MPVVVGVTSDPGMGGTWAESERASVYFHSLRLSYYPNLTRRVSIDADDDHRHSLVLFTTKIGLQLPFPQFLCLCSSP